MELLWCSRKVAAISVQPFVDVSSHCPYTPAVMLLMIALRGQITGQTTIAITHICSRLSDSCHRACHMPEPAAGVGCRGCDHLVQDVAILMMLLV